MTSVPAIELRGVSKHFGSVIALRDIDIKVYPGQVHCLLGDNGAGKSTLIKILSGVHQPTHGEILIDGVPVRFRSPRDAAEYGVATVFQDLGMIPLMSIRDPTQAVGTLSGGERQSVAIARAIHFGAKVLILDEPTSALGVHQAAMVLKFVIEARLRGLAVIFISHNIHHAYPVGDVFTLLNRGRRAGTFGKSEISRDEVVAIMSGGEDLKAVEAEIDALLASIKDTAAPRPSA
ncbi:MAG: sugar ABC transporter ATP-binding protein [Rhizobiales bacterium]|nr:sugar ABC transporter ATP-binding protein [Hyphomicrobiales bacterium]